MAHCKACNEEYTPRTNKLSHQEEDLCSECLVISRLSAYDLDIDYSDNPDDILDYFD